LPFVFGRATPYLLVALGGALGAVARFAVGEGLARRLGTSWPYGTFFINLSGCFLIALFLGAAAERNLNPAWWYLFPTGFVGAYTTFSTYEYETMRLFQRGQATGALAYVALSNVLGFGAVLLGAWMGRR
jgi:CrcB protein